ncbi:MAG: hypothetical protein ONB23_12340 [candidate division KSB1 bacterium]|nr:hypothetical protein [candidate division KSB1 bacterium]
MDGGGFAERGPYARIKNPYLLQAYALMKYHAVNVAEPDLKACSDTLLRSAQSWGIPFVASNLKLANGQDLPFARPHLLIEPWGEGRGTVGILGLSIAKLPAAGKGEPDWWRREDPIACARRIVGQLRKSCDLIVALVYGDESEVRSFAKEVDGLDVVISGLGTYYIRGPEPTDRAILCVNGVQGRYVGDVLLERPRGSRSWRVVEGELFPLDSSIGEAPEVAKIVEQYNKALQEELRVRH